MSQTNVESDPLFQLVTDALRAGPGSPEWHQAVAKLRDGGDAGANADEYKMLVTVREHLESGRDYRSVRAGPGFTRRLMDNLDKEPGPSEPRKGLPTATLIFILSTIGLVAVLAFVGWQIFHTTPQPPPAVAEQIDELQRANFGTEVVVATFDGSMPAIPSNWRREGRLPLDAAAEGGLRLAPPVPGTPSAAAGGAVVAPEPVQADEPFSVEAKLLLDKPAEDVLVEVFVTTDPNFSPDRATSGNELVWSLQGKEQRVVLAGNQQPEEKAGAPRPESDRKNENAKPVPLTVRILVNKNVAVVESNQQRLWAGPHQLPAKPRYVGIRFIRSDAAAKTPDPATVESIRVVKR